MTRKSLSPLLVATAAAALLAGIGPTALGSTAPTAGGAGVAAQAQGKAAALWCERNVGGVRHYTLVRKPKRCLDFSITRSATGGAVVRHLKKIRYKSKWGKKTVRAKATVKLSSAPRFRAAVRFTGRKKLGPCHASQVRFDKTYTRIWVRFPKGQESEMTGKRWQLIGTPTIDCY